MTLTQFVNDPVGLVLVGLILLCGAIRPHAFFLMTGLATIARAIEVWSR